MSDFNSAIERLANSNFTIDFSNADDGLIVVSAGKLVKNMEVILKDLNVDIQYVVTRNDYSLMLIKTNQNSRGGEKCDI